MEARLAELEAEIAGLRRQAAADPDHLYPALAYALAELSEYLREEGRAGEALAAAREAENLFRHLVDHDDDYRQPFAAALNNLAGALHDTGLAAEAVEFAREAVDVAASLPGDGDAVLLNLARLTLAGQLFSLGAGREGAAVLCEAGRAVRRLVEADRREEAGLPLHLLQVLADHARETRAWEEHVAYRRALALALPGDPPAGRAVLAYALEEAAAACAEDDPAAALAWAEQAVTEFARLAAEDPARYAAPRLQAAERWLHLAHADDDPDARERAARALASAGDGDRRGRALTMLAVALEEQARFDEALAVCDEAVEVWRALPDEGRRLASCLNLRIGLLSRLGRAEEALDAAAEAVALWRAAETVDPESDAAIYADTLRAQAALLAGIGRWEAALAVIEEGTRLVLSSIIEAGVGSSALLGEFERLRGECLSALGRRG
ncbi:MAG: tetratricopeptide repeat protein [Pseudomonadota bacterium]